MDLDKFRKLLKHEKLSESECLHLLVLIRQEIEELGKESNCDYIKFFADLAVHRKIDRSSTGSTVIVNINSIVTNGAAWKQFLQIILEIILNHIVKIFKQDEKKVSKNSLKQCYLLNVNPPSSKAITH